MSERIFCTVITKNYLAYARTLAETLSEHHSDSKLYVLIVDRIEEYFQPEAELFEVIRFEDLPDQKTIEQMCFYYTPLELCCALRGMLHEYIVEHTNAESWIFLDCDIMVCSSLEPLFEALSETSILLTPHCSVPLPVKDAEHELNILMHGLSNAGFLGLRRTEQTREFLAWWKDRLKYYCFLDSALGDPRGLSVDQRWLNLVFLYFPDFKFVKHPGANIGHWNFYERKFQYGAEGKILVNGQPVLFLHFSGWDIDNPDYVSKHSPLYQEKDTSPWTEFARSYREKLLKNGYEETKQFPYTFATFHDRTPITQVMRRGYYDELKQGTAIANSPFDQPEHFRSKRYSLNSTHFLQEEVRIAYEQVIQLQQEKHHIYLTLEQAQTTLEQKEATLQQLQTALVEVQQNAEKERTRSRQIIETMENSIFWKMRDAWWRIKRKLGQAEVKLIEKE
ncbi:glycosyl transferase, group 1 [Leptolyngbya sp. NIES-3755]|nr:glycosyl transferase, group 1 [Leptolyngbya sp. NIES-3755]